MANIDKNVRYNTDFKYLMFHQSEHVRPVTGAEINAAAVQEGFFGIAQDIVININGQYDLTARWIRAASSTQYEKNVPLYKIFKYAMHDLSDSCTKQQMNYQAVHVLLIGNFDEEPPSIAQSEAVRKLIIEAVYQLPTLRDVLFHSEVEGISCPGIFMRPNKTEMKREFMDARSTRDITIYEPLSVVSPVLWLISSSSTQTVLGWTTLAAAVSYNMYRKHIGVDSQFVLVTNTASTTYTDTDIVGTHTYDYVVTAVFPVTGEGPTSNVVTVTVPVGDNPNDYLYAFDSLGTAHTIGILDRANPTYIGSQAFSPPIVTSSGGCKRMFITPDPNNTLIVSYGGSVKTRVHLFDYQTNRTSLILKSSILLGANGTDITTSPLYRNEGILLRCVDYEEVWGISNPASPIYEYWNSVYDPGMHTIWRHSDSPVHDPDGKVYYSYCGGPGSNVGRFINYNVADDNDISLGAPAGVDMNGCSELDTMETRMILQRRMPSNPNILWGLTDASWKAYACPITVSSTQIGTLRAYGSDYNPQSWYYGRCYLVDNRYMFMTILYDALPNYGCYVWDVNDPTSPVFVSTLGALGNMVSDIAITDFNGITYAYLLGTINKTITVVDITNIAAPVTVSTTVMSSLGTTMNACATIYTPRQYTGHNAFLIAPT